MLPVRLPKTFRELPELQETNQPSDQLSVSFQKLPKLDWIEMLYLCQCVEFLLTQAIKKCFSIIGKVFWSGVIYIYI